MAFHLPVLKQTYTGSILIAVNPFTRLPHLYNEYMMEQYKGIRLGELSPHVFAVADASYRYILYCGWIAMHCFHMIYLFCWHLLNWLGLWWMIPEASPSWLVVKVVLAKPKRQSLLCSIWPLLVVEPLLMIERLNNRF